MKWQKLDSNIHRALLPLLGEANWREARWCGHDVIRNSIGLSLASLKRWWSPRRIRGALRSVDPSFDSSIVSDGTAKRTPPNKLLKTNPVFLPNPVCYQRLGAVSTRTGSMY